VPKFLKTNTKTPQKFENLELVMDFVEVGKCEVESGDIVDIHEGSFSYSQRFLGRLGMHLSGLVRYIFGRPNMYDMHVEPTLKLLEELF
jgi:hypothetical protein